MRSHSDRIASVDIDLNQLREMHPKLATDRALSMVGQAAMALERNATRLACGYPWTWNKS